MRVYAPQWFPVEKGTSLQKRCPAHLYNGESYRYLKNEMRDIADPAIQRSAYYAQENLLLSIDGHSTAHPKVGSQKNH